MCLILYVSLQMPKVLRGLGCILEVYLEEGSICSISQRNLSYTYTWKSWTYLRQKLGNKTIRGPVLEAQLRPASHGRTVHTRSLC